MHTTESNAILDTNGPMTPAERTAMERHPRHSFQILDGVGAFKRFARTAALHHEKLDGSGYPYGLTGAELDLPARILVVDALGSVRGKGAANPFSHRSVESATTT